MVERNGFTPDMQVQPFMTGATTYTVYSVSPVVGPTGEATVTQVFQAPALVEVFQAIPRLGLADKPHIVTVTLTLVSPFRPRVSSPVLGRPAGQPEFG